MQKNWDEEYANSAYIPGSEILPELWASNAASYRLVTNIQQDIAYGPGARNHFDLVLPAGPSKGLVVFVHGGYWLACSKSDWTDLAEGARSNGWSVAIPSYTLAPAARIAHITREIADAISCAAAMVAGPIRLIGHSAGGHLVTRMNCANSPLAGPVLDRISRTISISGLNDLRLLRRTKMNAILQLDADEARSESPALLEPHASANLTCWVGSDKRPEFLRQSRLLALMWDGLAKARLHIDQGHNHYSILAALTDPNSALVTELLREE